MNTFTSASERDMTGLVDPVSPFIYSSSERKSKTQETMLVNHDFFSASDSSENCIKVEAFAGDSPGLRRQPVSAFVPEPVDAILNIEQTRISLDFPLSEFCSLTIGQPSEG